ncbi:hypothetical protein E3T34_01050 [Cryobacterium sp. TMT1-62]|uniref:hypothetical protein n=1 Tax=Cryobacterium sp. TMT1-62 TaxID=1259240 RepID=UPI001069B8D0|nr:hypothetical protein [Cryobacterium sp. TMT1-62]TFD36290.1 hypothetical protein E3T34_01050 [Cryobacterium sp. TMT1-62]
MNAFANTTSETVTVLEVDRKSQYEIVRAVSRILQSVASRTGRPIRVLIDLAGTSRFTALAVMAWGFRSGIVAEFEFSYALATGYQVSQKSEESPYLFRSGDWLPTPIPGLGRPGTTGTRNRLIVSAGFEGKRTRRLIEMLEPDELVLLLSNSPDQANNETLESELPPLRTSVISSRLTEVAVSIDDIDEMIQQIRNASILMAHEEDRSVSILLAGPKSVSLAAAVASISGDTIRNVFYVQSERHEPVDVLGISRYLLITVSVPWSRSVLAEH